MAESTKQIKSDCDSIWQLWQCQSGSLHEGLKAAEFLLGHGDDPSGQSLPDNSGTLRFGIILFFQAGCVQGHFSNLHAVLLHPPKQVKCEVGSVITDWALV